MNFRELRKFAIIVNLISIMASSATASKIETPRQMDFASGYTIEFSGAPTILEFSLSDDVLSTVVDPNLLDVGVFNGRGELVPHRFMSLVDEIIETPPEIVNLTPFPVPQTPQGNILVNEVKIEMTTGGPVISVLPAAEKNRPEVAMASGYIVDATKVEGPIGKFEFVFESPDNESYFERVMIRGGPNLASQFDLGVPTVVTNIEVNGERLTRNTVDILGKHPFYQISFLNPKSKLKITGIKAHLFKPNSVQKVPSRFLDVAGEKKETTSSKMTYEFDLKGYYPIDGLSLRFNDKNSYARFSIEGSNKADGPWFKIGQDTFYSVIKDGAELSDVDTVFPRATARYVRLTLDSDPAGIGSTLPMVKFSWRPTKVQFLARGEGPYLFAFGSANKTNPQKPEPFETTFKGLVMPARLGEEVALGGDEKLVTIQESNFPWKKVALWVVLGVAVLLLGGMIMSVRNSNLNEK